MGWVVDTCLLLDIGLDDPDFALASEKLLETKRTEGLVICPVTFVELAPAFSGKVRPAEEFLSGLGVGSREIWKWEDTRNAGAAWTQHVQKRKTHQVPKRPIADMLIGAFALRFQGLLTRNAGDFRKVFPQLKLMEP